MTQSAEERRSGEESASDEELALAARDGSRDAFSRLVERHQDRLFRFLLQKTGNRHDAEDLAQMTFVTAYRKLSRYQSQDRFGAWLFTIAHRQAIGHFRSFFRRKRLHENVATLGEDRNEIFDPARGVEGREESSVLWRIARTTLSKSQHTALWLFYAEEMPVVEIAAVLRKSPGNVKVMLHRARGRLATELMKEENGQKYRKSFYPEVTL